MAQLLPMRRVPFDIMHSFAAILVALLILPLASSEIQAEPNEAPPPPPPAEQQPPPAGPPREMREKGRFGENPRRQGRPPRPNLSPEDRQKLIGALRGALRNKDVRDAQERLQRASTEFEQVMTEALLREDPSLEPMLDEMQGMLAAMAVARMQGSRSEQGRRPQQFASPQQGGSAPEREERRFDPAIASDPDVRAAREEVENATSRPERINALQKLRDAVEAAKAKSDAAASPAPADE